MAPSSKKTGEKAKGSIPEAPGPREDIGAIQAPCEVPPFRERTERPVCQDALLEEWSDVAISKENWHLEGTAFVDETAAARELPWWLSRSTSNWDRASQVLARLSQTSTSDMPSSAPDQEAEQPPRVMASWPPAIDRAFADAVEDHGPDETPAPAPIEVAIPWRQRRRDAALATLVELVATYGTAPGWPNIWESIHPQDSSGRPFYNAGGKYVVKLWLAGKWRRMVIDDWLPVDQRGIPVLLSSTDPTDIWPNLIAKAVYKLWALLTPGEDCFGNFVALACHALAGWLTSPISPPLECEALVCELKASGVPNCQIDDVALAATSCLPESPTKRRRGRRRSRSREPSADILEAAVAARKKAAEQMSALLDAPRDELVIVILKNQAELSAVLAIVEDDENQLTRELLLEWRCSDATPEDFVNQLAPLPEHRLLDPADIVAESQNFVLLRVSTCQKCTAHMKLLDRSWRHGDVLAPPPASRPMLLYVDNGLNEGSLTISVDADTAARGDSPPVVLTLREVELPQGIVQNAVSAPKLAPQVPSQGQKSAFVRICIAPEKRRFAMSTATVEIPEGGKVYRVQFEAPLGARALFVSASPLILDSMREVFQTTLGLGNVDQVEGEHSAIPPGAHRIIFRRKLQTHDVNSLNIAEEKCGVVEALTEIWLSEPLMRPFVRLHAFNLDTGDESWLPLLNYKALVALGGRGIVLTAVAHARSGRPLPSGTWAMYAISRGLTISSVDHPNGLAYARYVGNYRPNCRLRIFSDVLTIPAKAFPLHLVLDTSFDTTLPFEMRVYAYQDRSLDDEDPIRVASLEIGSTNGDPILAVKGFGSVKIPCFWPAKPIEKIVLEAFIDSDPVDVPVSFRSLRPYAVDDADPASSLSWQLEIASRGGGLDLRPDFADQIARSAIRASWEAAHPGRAARAAALRAHYLAQCKSNSLNATSKDHEDDDDHKVKGRGKGGGKEPQDSRMQAIVPTLVDPETELQRQTLRRSLPAPVIQVLPAMPDSLAVWNKLDEQRAAEAPSRGLACPQCTADDLLSQIKDAADREKREVTLHAAALKSWREAFLQTAKNLLAEREAYRLQVAKNATTAQDNDAT